MSAAHFVKPEISIRHVFLMESSRLYNLREEVQTRDEHLEDISKQMVCI